MLFSGTHFTIKLEILDFNLIHYWYFIALGLSCNISGRRWFLTFRVKYLKFYNSQKSTPLNFANIWSSRLNKPLNSLCFKHLSNMYMACKQKFTLRRRHALERQSIYRLLIFHETLLYYYCPQLVRPVLSKYSLKMLKCLVNFWFVCTSRNLSDVV